MGPRRNWYVVSVYLDVGEESLDKYFPQVHQVKSV